MSTCVTSATAAFGLAAGLLAAAVAAEPLALRGETTLGVRFYELEDPFDADEVSSFFDQYRTIRDEDADHPYFVDLFHLDLGLLREDETPLVRLQRWSPHARNERTRLRIDWRGAELDLEERRFQTQELRVFPLGTGAACGAFDPCPVFGTTFSPDTPFASLFENDRRLYVYRQGVRGELSLRPDGFEHDLPLLDEVRLFGGFERRRGERQDRFLLDADREAVDDATTGLDCQTCRFRAYRRELDQQVSRLGGGLVLSPSEQLTASLELDFERFREDAPVVTLGSLAARDPGIVVADPASAERPFRFVPDTDRRSAALRFTSALGRARFHGGAFFTRLEDADRRDPLKQRFRLDHHEVTTTSAHGAFELPLGRGFELDGHAKFVRRRNDPDERGFTLVAPPEFAFDPDGQVDPVYEGRSELALGLEAVMRPRAGSLVGVGYRYRHVERDLDFAESPGAILPAFNLLESESRVHTAFVRGRTRLLRRVQLSGELGLEWAPRTGFPRELETARYAEGRGSWAWVRPLPVTLSLFARYRAGENDDVLLRGETPERSERKGFELERFAYGVTLSAVPVPSLVVFGSFVQDGDEQEWDHVRSNLPRYFGPAGLRFFLDSDVDYRSDVRVGTVGLRWQALEALELSLASTLTRVRVRFRGDAPSAGVFDGANGFESRILSLDAGLGLALSPRLRLTLGYRLDGFREDRPLELLDLDTDVHTLSVGLTFAFSAASPLP